jgi:NAD(P)-dependent dehydrogenase (short-subunit alcohol dehydrogenase family)
MLAQQGGGHVVNLTTTLVGQPLKGVPSALTSFTKCGLDAVTRSLAIEFADRGIRVNTVAPGNIRMPMHAPETLPALSAMHPLGRMGEVGGRRSGALPGVGRVRLRQDCAHRRRGARRPLVTAGKSSGGEKKDGVLAATPSNPIPRHGSPVTT